MIELRDATDSDLELILAWRNNPLIWQGFYTQRKPLTWEEHFSWWRSRRNWHEFIIVYDHRDVGVLTLGQLDHWSPEIGYAVGEVLLWGKGVGKEAVRLACEWLIKKNYKYTHTTVIKTNERSIRLLKSLGFKYLGEAREGESWYQMKF